MASGHKAMGAREPHWLTPSLLPAQLVSGAVGGIALGVLGVLLSLRLFGGNPAAFADLVPALAGALGGFALGIAIAVWFTGHQLGGGGRFWAALVGSLAGLCLGLAIMFVASAVLSPLLGSLLGWLMVCHCSTAGAVIGSSLSQRQAETAR